MFKYRKLNRLSDFDYSVSGYYFVTICTDNHANYFGIINNSTTALTPIGIVAGKCMREIPEHFKSAQINEYIIMPNHVHAIIFIKDNQLYNKERNAHAHSLQISNQGLSKIIQQYKAAVKRIAGKKGVPFGWQKSFYDHVIRNEKSYLKIKEYIINNPIQWTIDVENTDSTVKDTKKYYEGITGYVTKTKRV